MRYYLLGIFIDYYAIIMKRSYRNFTIYRNLKNKRKKRKFACFKISQYLILLVYRVSGYKKFLSLDGIRTRNLPFLKTTARTNLPLGWDFIFLTTHQAWKIRYISRWRRSENQLCLSRKTWTNLSLLEMLFFRTRWVRELLLFFTITFW